MSNSNNTYTEDFAIIMQSSRERYMALQIMQAWDKDGLPDDFYEDNVRFAFNRNSGYVFLVNDDCQVCMLNEGRLEVFYTSPYNGFEGFIYELIESHDSGLDTWHIEDIEWLNELKEYLGIE